MKRRFATFAGISGDCSKPFAGEVKHIGGRSRNDRFRVGRKGGIRTHSGDDLE